MPLIIVTSGPIAVGKSMLITALVENYGANRISTRQLIQSLVEVPSERGPLQEAGERLDRETGGKWVADELANLIKNNEKMEIVIIDSVRIPQQVAHLKTIFGGSVNHVHLTAEYETLVKRFDKRKAAGDPAVQEFATYDEARANPTEAGIEKLGDIADIKVTTDDMNPTTLARSVAEKLGLKSTS